MTVKTWWIVLVVALAMTLVAEFFITPHPVFGMDGTTFFHAWYGFVACAGIIFFSKFVGLFLKRKTGYYKGERDD